MVDYLSLYCTDDIRLVGSDSLRRLEVLINGQWGTVCGTFTKNAADVACRQLQGFGQAAEYGPV